MCKYKVTATVVFDNGMPDFHHRAIINKFDHFVWSKLREEEKERLVRDTVDLRMELRYLRKSAYEVLDIKVEEI